MEVTNRQNSICEPEPSFIFIKKLVPIDEYAKERGLSREIVEDCGQIGIVQIRKYKGKTFVVDLPVSPYQYSSDQSPTGLLNNPEFGQKVAELVKKIESTQSCIDAGSVQKSESSKRIQTSAKTLIKTQTATKPFKPKVEPQQKPSTVEPVGVKIIKRPESDDTLGKFQNRVLADQAKSKRIWKVTALVLFALVFAAFVISFWLYTDNRIQIQTAEYAYATVQQIHKDLLKTKGQIETLQSRLAGETQKLALAKAELKSSYAQLQSLRDQLATARRDIELLKKNHSRKVQMLNEQIAELTKSLKELIENSPHASN
jgi:DNA repair exonuclease SbcCD ATPase subunit